MQKILRLVRNLAAGLLLVTVAAVLLVSTFRDRRPDVSELGWAWAETVEPQAGAVSATWLGISTLLFDDGETQILVDGMFTRLKLHDILLFQKISSDVANINLALARYRIDRLAAIVPVHSHVDHAMDAGLVANRTTAVILGSESTANIARGANVPVGQYQILASGEARQFGAFTITLLASRHAPLAPPYGSWLAGSIDAPLRQPARVTNWQEGIVYSVIIDHPRGTTLIQGSGGFLQGKLEDESVDVVMLGIGGLARLGKDHFDSYWEETVTATGAERVFPIHFDDFTMPFGELHLLPYLLDDAPTTARWADAKAASEDQPVTIQLLPFGEPVELY